jgi:hypothetical protein
LESEFSPAELAEPERSFKRLVLAAQDMVECRAAANFLQERNDLSGDARRALETAIPVAYARPWTKSRKKSSIGPLGGHWRPSVSEQLALHNYLINVRNKLYAHTDEDFNARWVHGMDALLHSELLIPAWRPLNLDRLPEIAELADAQCARLAEGALELRRAQSVAH